MCVTDTRTNRWRRGEVIYEVIYEGYGRSRKILTDFVRRAEVTAFTHHLGIISPARTREMAFYQCKHKTRNTATSRYVDITAVEQYPLGLNPSGMKRHLLMKKEQTTRVLFENKLII